MLKRHFKYCKKCNEKLLNQKSDGYGSCYYCRNYKKIELIRMNQWNEFWSEMDAMPQKNRFEIYQRKTVAMDLFKSKKHFIKTGYMIPPNRKRENETIENISIMLARKDPRIEHHIQWIKYNKQGKTVNLKETKIKRSLLI